MRYAIVKGTKVVNTAVGDSPMNSNWVQSEVAQKRWKYDGVTLSPPLLSEGKQLRSLWKKLQERKLFELEKDVVIGNKSAPFEDLKDNIASFDGSKAVRLSYEGGNVKIPAGAHSTLVAILKDRPKKTHERAHDIREAVEGEPDMPSMKVKFKDMINSGWPT